MDAEEIAWLAELIQSTVNDLTTRPGMTVEVDGLPQQWVQLIPQMSLESAAELTGYLINFPFQIQPEHSVISGESFPEISLPSGTELVESVAGSHATLWVSADTPPYLLANLCRDILVKIVGANPQVSINVQFEYGL